MGRTRSWRVELTSGSGASPPGDDTFAERVARCIARRSHGFAGPVIAADPLLQRLSLMTCVDATTADEAVEIATRAWHLACRDAAAGGNYIGIAAIVADIDTNAAGEDRQELLGTPDIAERLGVTRERVRQLVEARGRFPVPAARIRHTYVWRWGDIADWLALDRRRRPGRPTKPVVVEVRSVYRKLRRRPGPRDESHAAYGS